ncbi:hypothetical protein [Haloarchaeobius sp. HME9146]|uniref:DUF7115 domain-containing protein n=1 Tax=Haloarchaeobius sp. HME9146 TaxID=2978732 RepID=UPI0021BE8F15|nr:hypothetical protein [Haloarchaeobius sp. HME9146]MCT9097470.1 hypothetical protein [Haloarchaeobius sp. HME9146]
MDVPGIVESTLAGEDVAAEVSLGGENVLYVTPTRTLIYQSEGFLSDESVDEYPHEAERLTVKEGRRKTRITLEYSLDGERDFTVPANVSESVVHPVLAGVLNASGVTNPGETVTQTFRFSELTVVITSERLVKHVGGAVWDEDYEEYHFADVTGLSFEDGSVATQVVLEVDGRPERIKIANDRAAEVKEYLQQSLFAYYDVRSLDALNDAVRPEEVDEDERPSPIDFGEGVDPLDAGNTVQPDEVDVPAEPPAESAEELLEETQHAQAQDTTPEPQAQQEHAQQSPPSGQTAETGQQDAQQADPLAGGANTSTDAGSEQYDQSSAPRSQQQDTQPPRQEQRPSQQQQHDTQPAQETHTQETRTQETRDKQPAGQRRTGQEQAQSQDAPAASDQEPRADARADTESAATSQTEPVSEPVTDEATAEPESEPADAGADDDATPFEAAGFQPATADGTDDAVLERLDTLEQQVEKQNELLERQGVLIQQLIDELSRSR